MKAKKTFLAAVLVTNGGLLSEVSAESLLYVPTGESNEIVVIDAATHKITNRIGELENAHGLAAAPDGAYLVAGSQDESSVAGEWSADKPAAVTEEEHEAHHKASASAGKSFLSIVNREHGHVQRRIAVEGRTHHTAVSPNGKFAIAVHTTTGGISVVDLEQSTVIKKISTGSTPNYAVFDQAGDFVYVSNAGAGTVSKIATDKWEIVEQIAVGKGPEHLEMAPDGETLFVVNVIDGTVSAINVADSKVVATYDVGKSPHGASVSADGKYLFASAKGEDLVIRITLATGDKARAPVAPEPYHVSYIRGIDKVYVSSRAEPKIWVIDPLSLKVEDAIDIGSGVAHQLVEIDR